MGVAGGTESEPHDTTDSWRASRGHAGAGYVRRCKAGNIFDAGRGEASSSVKIYAPELQEAFILGALLRGGYRPFETIFLGGMAEATAGWRWGVTGSDGRDGFETMLLGRAA